MPVATVSTDTETVQLKTCPGAFVELRQLPYGKLLHRRDKASRMSMQQNSGNRKKRQSSEEEVSTVNIETLQEWTRHYEFKECIVDHNLEAPDGRKLDFNNPIDFKMLNPKIGSEIERHIDELNQEEEEEDSEEDFFSASTDSSLQEATPPSTKKS